MQRHPMTTHLDLDIDASGADKGGVQIFAVVGGHDENATLLHGPEDRGVDDVSGHAALTSNAIVRAAIAPSES